LAFETKHNAQTSLRGICRDIIHEQTIIPSVPLQSASSSIASAAASTALKPVSSLAGIANFYRGFVPTLLGMLPYAGMSFLTHDMLGDFFRSPSLRMYTVRPADLEQNPNFSSNPTNTSSKSRPQLKAWAELLAGGLAGIVSQTASYPLEVIRRRMQVGGAVGDRHRMKLGETAKKILAERGLRGFYVGLGIGYIKIGPMSAVSFFVYERAKVWLGV
jgi:solute carrier family 25 protein 16